MLPEQQMLPEQECTMLDQTKPIVVVSGSAHQAEDKTLAAAKALAKQLIGDRTITATIYVPHTQVERPVPPLKSTRIKFE
jgi:mitochondrial fission protein ELM1